MRRCSSLGKGGPWTLRSSPSVGDNSGSNNHQWGWPLFPPPRGLGGAHTPGEGSQSRSWPGTPGGEQQFRYSCPEAALRKAGSTELEWGVGTGKGWRGEGPVLVSLRAERCPRLAGARSLTKEQDVVDLSPNHREEMIVNFL